MFDHLMSSAIGWLLVTAFVLTAAMILGSFVHYCAVAGRRAGK